MINSIKRLIDERQYYDASALAIHLNKTYETRRLFSKDKSPYSKEKFDAYENLLLVDSREDFDIYNQFLDYRQPPHRKLYLDRRKYLKEISDIVTNMYFPKRPEDEVDVVRIKLRTRSAKSEAFNRALMWVQSNFPNGESLYAVGGGNLKDGIHAKRTAFIEEYWERHLLVFPEMTPRPVESKDKAAIWFNKREYADISTVTVGGSIEGWVQCTNMLVLDDLVSSNEINSVKRLEEIYSSDIQNAINRRLVGSPKIVIIGTPIPTLTGIQDPLDRYFDNRKEAGLRCVEVVVPSLDENGESNYWYRDFSKLDDEGNPLMVFTTEEFQAEKKAAYASGQGIEIARFNTVYQMQPMAVGDLLFANLNEFDELPEGKYKEITYYDPADKGEDSATFMYCRVYDVEPDTLYLVDMFRSRKPMVRAEHNGHLDELVDFIVDLGLMNFTYEENMGKELLGNTIVDIAKELGHHLEYESIVETKNKIKRIRDHAPQTLKAVKINSVPPSKMYEEGIEEIKSWSENAKHDDAPDCLVGCVKQHLSGKRKPNRYSSYRLM